MAVPQEKTQYDGVATDYKSYDDLPMAKLEHELIRTALGDCTGLKILDLGGGSGTHARQALNAGASLVDVADISEAMMQIGKDIEASSASSHPPGRGELRWFAADAGKPLAEQGAGVLPAGSYDVVMANWVFDHAHTIDDLKGMWSNIVSSLKPGGRFVGIRVTKEGIWADYVLKTGKYGCRYEDVAEIPGGVECKVFLLTDPPFTFGGTMMEDSYARINAIPKEMGLKDFQTVPTEEAEIVKKDKEYWQEHLDQPLFAVMTAVKA